jgi:hypothetical protein
VLQRGQRLDLALVVIVLGRFGHKKLCGGEDAANGKRIQRKGAKYFGRQRNGETKFRLDTRPGRK